MEFSIAPEKGPEAGTYDEEIEIVTGDPVKASITASFTVEDKIVPAEPGSGADDGSGPETGDDMALIPLILLAAAALAGSLVAVKRREL